jgi:hypothetical protein
VIKRFHFGHCRGSREKQPVKAIDPSGQWQIKLRIAYLPWTLALDHQGLMSMCEHDLSWMIEPQICRRTVRIVKDKHTTLC